MLVIKVPQSVADEYIVHDAWPGDEVFLGEGDAPWREYLIPAEVANRHLVRSSKFSDPPVSLDGAINDLVVGEMNPAHGEDTFARWAEEAVRSRERQEATAVLLGRGVSSPAIPDLGQLLDRIKVEGWGDVSIAHGWEQWNQVARIGVALASEMPATDAELVFLFALLHDAQRMSEDSDPERRASIGLCIQPEPARTSPARR